MENFEGGYVFNVDLTISGEVFGSLVALAKRSLAEGHEDVTGRTVAADAVDALVWRTSIPGNPNRGGVLVHGGTDTFDFKGVRVLPWFLR